jgi:hypothetical protein
VPYHTPTRTSTHRRRSSRSWSSRVLAAGVAVLTAVGLGAAVTPAAQADGRNIVTLGGLLLLQP